jgi:hypothetical protein
MTHRRPLPVHTVLRPRVCTASALYSDGGHFGALETVCYRIRLGEHVFDLLQGKAFGLDNEEVDHDRLENVPKDEDQVSCDDQGQCEADARSPIGAHSSSQCSRARQAS